MYAKIVTYCETLVCHICYGTDGDAQNHLKCHFMFVSHIHLCILKEKKNACCAHPGHFKAIRLNAQWKFHVSTLGELGWPSSDKQPRWTIKGSESGGGAAVNASRQLEDARFHFQVLWENLKRSCCERAGEGDAGKCAEVKYVPPPSPSTA